jgi:hypothetical protein
LAVVVVAVGASRIGASVVVTLRPCDRDGGTPSELVPAEKTKNKKQKQPDPCSRKGRRKKRKHFKFLQISFVHQNR